MRLWFGAERDTKIKEKREEVSSSELVLDYKALDALIDKTRKMEGSSEFWAFILGKQGADDQVVIVGVANDGRGVASPEMVMRSLAPYKSRGYRVKCDFHNHPPTNKEIYKTAGLPEELMVSPSTGDLLREIPDAVAKLFDQQAYPRVIAAHDGDRVIINAIRVNRAPNDDELPDIEFDNPIFETKSVANTAFTIRIVGERYGNQVPMLEKGIISRVGLKAKKRDGSIVDIETV